MKFIKDKPTTEVPNPKINIKSVRLPNGILYKADGTKEGGKAKWKTSMDSGMKTMFKNF